MGIAGIFHLDGRAVDRGDLVRMGTALSYGGRYAFEVMADGPVGLVQRRRLAPRVSAERPAGAGAASGVTVVADARVDNRQELAGWLGLDGRGSRAVADVELIHAAYARWGPACTSRLVGDFGFALWDERSAALVCARDPLGVRPVYYMSVDNTFYFGSEIKALLALDGVPAEIDEDYLPAYFYDRFEDATHTLYRGIYRLPGGHQVSVTSGGIRLHRYWAPDAVTEIRYARDEEYDEHFRALFDEAVSCRAPEDEPVGVFMSGGLDSTSIACTLRSLYPDRTLPVFSALYPGIPESDETDYIREVTEHARLDLHPVYPLETSAWDRLDEMIHRLDGPFNWPTWDLEEPLYRAAADAGIRVILSGHGGDHTASHGDGYLPYLFRSGRWARLAREAAGQARLAGCSTREVLWGEALRPLLRERTPETLLRLRRRALRKKDLLAPETLFHPQLAEKIRSAMERERVEDRRCRTVRAGHARIIIDGGLQVSNEMVYKMAMACGMEIRFPFLDQRLVAYCLSLPDHRKVWEGWTRYTLRSTMKGRLPESIRWRVGKAYFDPAVNLSFHVGKKTVRDRKSENQKFLSSWIKTGPAHQLDNRFFQPDSVKVRDLIPCREARFIQLECNLCFLEQAKKDRSEINEDVEFVG